VDVGILPNHLNLVFLLSSPVYYSTLYFLIMKSFMVSELIGLFTIPLYISSL
jgi:hypothetical protein